MNKLAKIIQLIKLIPEFLALYEAVQQAVGHPKNPNKDSQRASDTPGPAGIDEPNKDREQ